MAFILKDASVSLIKQTHLLSSCCWIQYLSCWTLPLPPSRRHITSFFTTNRFQRKVKKYHSRSTKGDECECTQEVSFAQVRRGGGQQTKAEVQERASADLTSQHIQKTWIPKTLNLTHILHLFNASHVDDLPFLAMDMVYYIVSNP